MRLSNGVAIALRISVPPGFPQVGDRLQPHVELKCLLSAGQCITATWPTLGPGMAMPVSVFCQQLTAPFCMQEKPVLSVASPVRHPWVDAIGRLSFPTLDRWSGSTMRLAAVVSEAMQGLASGTGSGQAGQPGEQCCSCVMLTEYSQCSAVERGWVEHRLPAGLAAGSASGHCCLKPTAHAQCWPAVAPSTLSFSHAGPPQQPGRPQQPGGAPQQQPGSGPPPPAAVPQRPRLPPLRTEFPELEHFSNADLLQALTNEEVYAEVLKRALATPAASSDGQQASEVGGQVGKLRLCRASLWDGRIAKESVELLGATETQAYTAPHH